MIILSLIKSKLLFIKKTPHLLTSTHSKETNVCQTYLKLPDIIKIGDKINFKTYSIQYNHVFSFQYDNNIKILLGV